MRSVSSRTSALRGTGPVNAAENCDWPPARCMNTSSDCATRRATAAPWSSSTRASARSIPAATPAEEYTRPSRTKIASGSTRTRGYRAARSRVNFQCVVARLPSSTLSSASTNAPLQMAASRRVRAARCAVAASTSGVTNRAGGCSLPGITTVSRSCAASAEPVTPTWVPIEVCTGAPSGDSITTS
ncbi:Uncharacterised protein [Mycobacteroides abscessus subsp. abscessus]|nr:Uncharacterised protein [Mycobacteroides abscessus subsp. abscessus]